MRFREPTIKVPVSEIEAREQLARREAAAHQSRVSFMLRHITNKIVDYPACPQSEMSIEDFRQQPASARRFARTAPIKVANMSDGVGVLFATAEFLEDRMHRLVLPTKDPAEYTRWAFNVDSQKIPSRSIEVVGLEHVVAHPDIYPSLNYCMGALAVEASHGWTNAFK